MPRIGSSVSGHVELSVYVLKAELRLTGYLITTSFPTTATIEFKKFPFEVRYIIIVDSFVSSNGKNICTGDSVATCVFVLIFPHWHTCYMRHIPSISTIFVITVLLFITHIYAHKDAGTHARAQTNTYYISCIHTYAYISIHMHVRTHACTHAHTHAHKRER